MADVFSRKKRSEIMSKVKSRDTKPEMIVRKHLHVLGFRYSLHNKKFPGKPDIALVSRKILIHVNGCFWHGHAQCNSSKLPSTNTKFWETKILTNMSRDAKNMTDAKSLGFLVITIWECELKPKVREETLKNLVGKIKAAEGLF